MRVWRITKPRHLQGAFDGQGAKRDGGRWNHVGVSVVYASESAALATLELLVRLQDVRLLKNYVLLHAEVPNDSILDLDVRGMPATWRKYPHSDVTQDAGDAWLRKAESLALRVPSVVVPGFNVLLNPAHPRFGDVVVGEPLTDAFDARLTG